MAEGEPPMLFQALIKALPHVMVTVALISILFIYGIKPFLWPNLTPAQQEFEIFMRDLEAVINAPTIQIQIPSVLTAKDKYRLRVYPAGYQGSPTRCQGKSCVCLYEERDTTPYETCRQYPEIKTCPTTQTKCGENLCFEAYKDREIEQGQPVTIQIRKDCNLIKVG